jgi:hypothetical protein
MRAVRIGFLSLLAGVAAVAAAGEPSAESGRALFIGARAFQAGGAPCGACHGIGGEGVPFTATLGPELSTSLAGMDTEALLGLLDTLPFVACGALIAFLLFLGLALNSRRRKPRSRARLIARAYPSHDGGSR